jgi:hypothetical protein
MAAEYMKCEQEMVTFDSGHGHLSSSRDVHVESPEEYEETTTENAPLIAYSRHTQGLDSWRSLAMPDLAGRRSHSISPDRRHGREHCENSCCRYRVDSGTLPKSDDEGDNYDCIPEPTPTITCLCLNKECTSDQKHCHRWEMERTVDRTAKRKLKIAIVLVVTFMTAEALGGYFSGSLAIMTDAAHMLSDFASYAISLSSMWLAERKPTKKMSFGFHRAGNKSVVIKMCLTRIIFS